MASRLPRRVVVREIVPGRLWLVAGVACLLLVGIAVVAWVGGRYDLARQLGGYESAGLLERLLEENRAMRDELAVARGGTELTREVEERVRTDNRQMQDRVAELEQAVAAYRRLGFPDPSGRGLRIENLAVVRSEAGWEMSLMLVRVGDKDGRLEGRFEGVLVADGPQGRVTLPLSSLLAEDRLAFGVRYVLELREPLQVPASLNPVRLDIAAVLTSPRPERIMVSWPAGRASKKE